MIGGAAVLADGNQMEGQVLSWWPQSPMAQIAALPAEWSIPSASALDNAANERTEMTRPPIKCWSDWCTAVQPINYSASSCCRSWRWPCGHGDSFEDGSGSRPRQRRPNGWWLRPSANQMRCNWSTAVPPTIIAASSSNGVEVVTN